MENLNSINVLRTILKNWKSFFLVMFISALISYAASFLLKEKFKSIAVIYPVNLVHNSEESPSEQLLQYLYSEDVKYQLAKEFNLFKRYKIDTLTSKGGKAMFNAMFMENITISPTIYESIEITVIDEDPYFAQKLNTALIIKTNNLIKETKRNIVKQYLDNSKIVIDIQRREVDSLKHSIFEIKSEYNIIDVSSQSKYLSKQLSKGSKLNEDNLKQVKGIREKGTELGVLENKIWATLNSYSQIKVKNDAYLMDVSGDMDFFVYVSKPNLQDKKCAPNRSVIALISTLSVFFMVLVFFLFKNRSKEII